MGNTSIYLSLFLNCTTDKKHSLKSSDIVLSKKIKKQ